MTQSQDCGCLAEDQHAASEAFKMLGGGRTQVSSRFPHICLSKQAMQRCNGGSGGRHQRATALSQDIHLAAGAVRRTTLTGSRFEVRSLRERRQWKRLPLYRWGGCFPPSHQRSVQYNAVPAEGDYRTLVVELIIASDAEVEGAK